MANYYGHARTNYFKIQEGKQEAFEELLTHIESDEDGIQVVTNDDGGQAILGLINAYVSNVDEDSDPEDITQFWGKLQPLLTSDSVVIYKEVGYEKLRYLVDVIMFITPTSIELHTSDDWIKQMAAELGVNDYNLPMY